MRATQFIDFINKKKIPTEEERTFIYSHISFTEKIMDIRRKYRRIINKQNKEKE